MSTARIINPNISTANFNKWYNTVYLPDFMNSHNASLALRYVIVPNPGESSKWAYLAPYKMHGNSATSLATERVWTNIGTRDIGPDDVALEFSSWTNVQTINSLREKRGNVPAGRPKIALVVKIEPKDGGEDELEDWYRKQHLDMLSMTPQYRRATKYRSADGSKPRWLAIHEQDSTGMDPYQGDVLMNTDLWNSVFDGIKLFEPVTWQLSYEKGNPTEKL